ncbi:MAG: NAD(P)/FAD-dependent oxidoreductase [Candidatus Omnitrophica bacterium]|nr:NAD(P)/FAD-dependent oxidoreductase [Candidatus Omnitrophota bacterium]
MEKTDVIIVGAGIVGLAIATAISKNSRSVIVVERNETFGQETSSRNSEIIHSGIYSPKDFLKTKLCLEGRRLLYQFCEEQDISHKRLGKLIVATDNDEARELDHLFEIGKDNGVEDLRLLSGKEAKELEPEVNAICAIESPSTGIVDTHQLMKRLEYLATSRKVVFAYSCEVTGIEKKQDGYGVSIRDIDGETIELFTRTVINSAGLGSEAIARMVGIDVEKYGYKLHYAKGEYFRLKASKAKLLNRLIYPTPKQESLGIHTVTDSGGQRKLGPNAFYVDRIDYDVDPSHKMEFYEAVSRYLPFLEKDDLTPDMSGIRAKLQGPGEAARDFVITDETDKGLPGFINLIGIESPGLTSSLAIAKHVECMI